MNKMEELRFVSSEDSNIKLERMSAEGEKAFDN